MLNYITNIRRELHKIPELANFEFKTQNFIALELDKLGIAYKRVFTGLIADIDAKKSKTIAFRTDMDALSITEQNDCSFKSTHDGCMHACGHDGHMAIMLGFAKFCVENTDKLNYNIRLIFQMAEEGEGGAKRLIEHGCLDGISEIYAIHLAPDIEGGVFGLKSGAIMAGAVEFDVEFFGRESHCAQPEKGKNALLAAANFASELSSCASKNDKILLHIGKLTSGTARNVVAKNAYCLLTLRYFSDAVKDKTMRNISSLLKFTTDNLGVKSKLSVRAEYIPLINNSALIDKVKPLVDYVQIKEKYLAEDFAYYATKCKGAMLFLGTKDSLQEKKLHSCDFNFDEKFLLCGVELFTKLATL